MPFLLRLAITCHRFAFLSPLGGVGVGAYDAGEADRLLCISFRRALPAHTRRGRHSLLPGTVRDVFPHTACRETSSRGLSWRGFFTSRLTKPATRSSGSYRRSAFTNWQTTAHQNTPNADYAGCATRLCTGDVIAQGLTSKICLCFLAWHARSRLVPRNPLHSDVPRSPRSTATADPLAS